MLFLDSLLLLLLAAILLLQVSRRIGIPYPSMLAGAGILIAFVPGVPAFRIEPQTALALFIAPALLDAAYDFPIGTARRYWAPLVAFAIVAVVVTACTVALIATALTGMPPAAALALGAIVAPPDAAAATAVLGALAIPRNTDAVLRGESLFNDATALVLFGAATAIVSHGGLGWPVATRLAVAGPGGIALGVAAAYATARVGRLTTGTLGGNILQFVNTCLLWRVADRIGVSPVLTLVAFGMTLARRPHVDSSPRMRVHSYAVWASVVFVLNVIAFLLMGMQARAIFAGISHAHLREAATLAGAVTAAVITIRLAVVVGFNRLAAALARRRGAAPPATVRQAVLVGWTGMRGLLTLATAFALGPDFPHRDEVVLCAFAVVIATLVVQGLTLAPLARLLRLGESDDTESELANARRALADAALEQLGALGGREADHLRAGYLLKQAADGDGDSRASLRRRSEIGLAAIRAERARLDALRAEHTIGFDTYGALQEELDWRALTLLPDHERRIEEG